MSEFTDPQVLEALRRDREARPPDSARARIASRLGVQTGLGGQTPGEASAATAKAAGGRLAAMLIATFVAGGGVGAALHARFAHSHGPRVVYVYAPASSVPGTQPSGAPSTHSAVPAAIDSTSSAPQAPTAAVVVPPRSRTTQLDAERALLDTARGALVSGDSDSALRALDRHAKTYRRPLLGEEHDALLVQALVQAGRYAEARAGAEALRRKFPQSFLLPAVDAAIASIP